ncbi:MAG: efflux RND transporter periplasmic adaptor subunit [Pseudomonadales bacterium]
MTGTWQRIGNQIKQSPRIRRSLPGLGILTVAVAVSAVIFATGPSAEPEAVSEKVWPVSTVVAEPQDLAPSFSAYGKVEARNLASLSADLFAVIKAIHVKEGDSVSAGTVLVELDDGELALDVQARSAEVSARSADLRSIESELAHLKDTDAEHRSMLDVAQAKLARHKQLRDDRLIADSVYDEVVRQTNEVKIAYRSHSQRLDDLPNRLQAAKAGLDGARAALARARLTAAKTQIIAPFDGKVLSVPAAIGARAQPGTMLVQIADANAYEVRVSVPPVYASQFTAAAHQAGASQPIEANTESGATLSFSRLAGSVRAGQTSADALFSWAPQSGPLASVGSTVGLRIEMPPAAQVIALPAQALYENQRVYVVEQERLRAVAIDRIGERQAANGSYEVLVRSPELQAGAEIITTQLPKAIAGLKVAPSRAAPRAPEQVAEQDQSAEAMARKAARMARDKQEQVREAVQRGAPEQISLPDSVRPAVVPAASGAAETADDDSRVSSRRYRMS